MYAHIHTVSFNNTVISTEHTYQGVLPDWGLTKQTNKQTPSLMPPWIY